MEHQDWETIVFKKKSQNDVTREKVARPVSNGQTLTPYQKPAWKIEQQVDSENGKPLNLVTSEVGKAIINGRIAMKLTQKQLAQRLNMQEKDIKDIESCKAVENKALIAKIKKTLGI
jgi:ribosome-binding protein aMBF1 (putative translation factor)